LRRAFAVQSRGCSTNDKNNRKHDTRKEIAEAAGVSTEQVAQAEIVRREAPEKNRPSFRLNLGALL
jgi:hypothetical protein